MKAVDRIHEYLRFGMVLGLERMNALMAKLGDPQKELEVIHVAGTNGKGSVCRYVYEVLRAAGYHTGLYTSPYLEVFNERIEADGEYISDEELEDAADRVIAAADEMVAEGMESPTEFEIVTAVAFVFFREKGCDFVVLEVGLGGRGDSTNIIEKPLCSIITSISLDHTDRLGETIPEIAAEKAGIIKRGCPVIVGAEDPDAKAVFRKRANELDAPLFDAARVPVKVVRETLEGCSFNAEILDREYRGVEIRMPGEHQIRNAVCALFAVTLLAEQGVLPELTMREIKEGMKRARQIGRFEVLSRSPYVILDGAHNPAGAAALKKTVLTHFRGKRILMVTGILADKAVDDVLSEFREITDQFIATEPPNPRKLDAEKLAEKLRRLGAACETAAEPEEAVRLAMSGKDGRDLILFTGSLYLIGALRGDVIRLLREDQE
ncbi:hypothetical protein BHK98_00175 [Hornefia porci]|uniref:Dihydrofolate synthase/folylpolyglutamate synthase n=1 Tax=Hornefia porci TaxID=2652292 RepID=A0A1Q9JET1_9FIRM|nr:folylpolyglutamate synthase/dihydrofolate synthase family protein [Hornefia porci]OLR54644.1 hypothetical protein BHK98_00175 [Hornefia porci]